MGLEIETSPVNGGCSAHISRGGRTPQIGPPSARRRHSTQIAAFSDNPTLQSDQAKWKRMALAVHVQYRSLVGVRASHPVASCDETSQEGCKLASGITVLKIACNLITVSTMWWPAGSEAAQTNNLLKGTQVTSQHFRESDISCHTLLDDAGGL